MQADKLNEQLRRSERYNRNKANAQDRIHEDQDLLMHLEWMHMTMYVLLVMNQT